MNREGFFLRAAAYLLDFVFCLVPALIIIFLASIAIGPWFAGVLSVGIFVGYSSLEIFRGATFGKTILNLKIATEDGTQPDRNTMIKRWAIKWASMLFYLLAAITTLTFFNYVGHFASIAFAISACLTFRAQRQTLHDTLTHTAVYKTHPAPAAAPAIPATPEPQKQAA